MELSEYPSPHELAAYIKGKRKAKGQFRNPVTGGKCCLGHYATMCGIPFPDDQPTFITHGDRKLPTHADLAVLPEDHWLLAEASYDVVQGALANLNDDTKGFSKVIKYLESLEVADRIEVRS